MNFQRYEDEAIKTAEFKLEDPLLYCLMGMAGEAGETLEKAKKIARKNATYEISAFIHANFDCSEDCHRNKILTEMGDVLWYLSQAARLMGSSLSEVAKMNIDKLASRAKRNVIVGEGDNR